MASIDLVGLTKRFGAFTAVKGLDLAIPDRKLVALLGPSGCGKSTTMNMIAGIETPSAGAIRFDGVDVAQVPPHRRNVGFVFQNYAIFTHMSVRENLAFALEVRGTPRREVERRVAEVAAMMRLADHLDWPSARLSVNELQKLAIGRSAIAQPAIFLLDEPLSNVDAAFRAFMRTELKHIQHELGQTMVYVTHDQTEAMSLADRIAVMSDAVLQQYGTPEEVYNRPGNLFVANFIGSPSMNLLPATATVADGRCTLDLGPLGRMTAQDPALAAAAQRAGGRPVVLGIRPEHVRLADAADAREGLAAHVRLVEPIGPRKILHLAGASGGAFVVVGDKRASAAEGAAVKAILPPAACLLFDAASGHLIAPEAGRGQA